MAVKLLTARFRDYSGSLAVLQREATKLQRLSHPNIVRVIDCDRDGHTVFMTMEYLSGMPLKRILESPHGQHLSSAETLEVIERISRCAVVRSSQRHRAWRPEAQQRHRDGRA